MLVDATGDWIRGEEGAKPRVEPAQGKRGAHPWTEMSMGHGYDGRRLGTTGRLLPKQERVASSLASWANRKTPSFGVRDAAVGDGWESGVGVRGAT